MEQSAAQNTKTQDTETQNIEARDMEAQKTEDQKKVGTQQKAFEVNLDKSKYGTFAEIGAAARGRRRV
jgi:hypothetical protein